MDRYPFGLKNLFPLPFPCRIPYLIFKLDSLTYNFFVCVLWRRYSQLKFVRFFESALCHVNVSNGLNLFSAQQNWGNECTLSLNFWASMDVSRFTSAASCLVEGTSSRLKKILQPRPQSLPDGIINSSQIKEKDTTGQGATNLIIWKCVHMIQTSVVWSSRPVVNVFHRKLQNNAKWV